MTMAFESLISARLPFKTSVGMPPAPGRYGLRSCRSTTHSTLNSHP
jgi:hypothetical protein